MPAGFQAFTEDARLQADSNTMMFGLVGKGAATVTAVGPSGYDQFSLSDLPPHQFAAFYSTAPIMLEQPGSGRAIKTSISRRVKAPYGSSYTVQYWLFSAYRYTPDPGFGAQAFRPGGIKIFDAVYPPLRVIDRFQILSMSSGMDAAYPIAAAAGRTIAFLAYGTVERRSGELIISEPGPPPINKYYRGRLYVRGDGAGFRAVEGQGLTRSANALTILSGGVLALDLTNH